MVREHRQNNIENIFNGTDRNRHQIRLIFTPFNHYIVFSLKFIDDDCKRQSNWELQSLKLKWHILWIHGNARIRTSSSLKGPGKIVAFTMQVSCKSHAVTKLWLVDIFQNDNWHVDFQLQSLTDRERTDTNTSCFAMKSISYFSFCQKTRTVMSCLSIGDCLKSERFCILSQAGLHVNIMNKTGRPDYKKKIFRLYILGACSDEHMQLHLEHTHACDVGLPLYENGKIVDLPMLIVLHHLQLHLANECSFQSEAWSDSKE
uniref:Uncharacterized protein n=1 Tax=Onchocerca volvulus TaxID=6282 RepID=A0A8R1TJY3_ONCVO